MITALDSGKYEETIMGTKSFDFIFEFEIYKKMLSLLPCEGVGKPDVTAVFYTAVLLKLKCSPRQVQCRSLKSLINVVRNNGKQKRKSEKLYLFKVNYFILINTLLNVFI